MGMPWSKYKFVIHQKKMKKRIKTWVLCLDSTSMRWWSLNTNWIMRAKRRKNQEKHYLQARSICWARQRSQNNGKFSQFSNLIDLLKLVESESLIFILLKRGLLKKARNKTKQSGRFLLIFLITKTQTSSVNKKLALMATNLSAQIYLMLRNYCCFVRWMRNFQKISITTIN